MEGLRVVVIIFFQGSHLNQNKFRFVRTRTMALAERLGRKKKFINGLTIYRFLDAQYRYPAMLHSLALHIS